MIKFVILDVYPNKRHRLIKDTAGGYGTGNDFGNTLFSKILNLYVDTNIGMPSIEIMIISSILKKDHKFPFNLKLQIKDDYFNEELSFEEYLSYLFNSRSYDKQFGGTKIGPHRSDISAIINNDFDASLLSTGQQKTIVLMILLAQCNYLVNHKNINPILLLDEIGSHLDSYNRQILLDMINRFEIQFFLSGTDKDLFSFISTNAKFYNITEL